MGGVCVCFLKETKFINMCYEIAPAYSDWQFDVPTRDFVPGQLISEPWK